MKRVLLAAAVFLCWAGCMSKHLKPALLAEVTIREQEIFLGQSAASVKARIGPPDEDLKVDQRRIVPGMFTPGAVVRAGTGREYHKWRYGDTFLVFEDDLVSYIYMPFADTGKGVPVNDHRGLPPPSAFFSSLNLFSR